MMEEKLNEIKEREVERTGMKKERERERRRKKRRRE